MVPAQAQAERVLPHRHIVEHAPTHDEGLDPAEDPADGNLHRPQHKPRCRQARILPLPPAWPNMPAP